MPALRTYSVLYSHMKIIVERTNFVAVSGLTGLSGKSLKHKYVFIAAYRHKSEIVDSCLLNQFQLELYLSKMSSESAASNSFLAHNAPLWAMGAFIIFLGHISS